MEPNEMEQLFMAMLNDHHNIIYKVCLMYADDAVSREDLVQDVIVNLWRAFPNFKGESKPSTWVYRIALNTCISQFRKRQTRPTTMSITYDLENLTDDDGETQARVNELYRMIGKLPPLDKAIVMLWLDEKSYDEISEMIGISKVNVGVRMMRIKQKLKEMTE